VGDSPEWKDGSGNHSEFLISSGKKTKITDRYCALLNSRDLTNCRHRKSPLPAQKVERHCFNIKHMLLLLNKQGHRFKIKSVLQGFLNWQPKCLVPSHPQGLWHTGYRSSEITVKYFSSKISLSSVKAIEK